jgi:ABC-type transport system involved in cytochrome bd biosynthesis fused ATPase/permease subunit
MKVHLMFSFISWMLKNATQGIRERSNDFREGLRENIPFSIIQWFIVSLICGVAVLMITLCIANTSYAIGMTMEIYFGSCLAYLVFQAFAAMFDAFMQERDRVNDYLKGKR